VEALLHQTYKLDHVYLNLADVSGRYNEPYIIPEALRTLERNSPDFTIVRCNPDIGSLMLYLCVLAIERSASTRILVLDDDIIYHPLLAERLLELSVYRHPGFVVSSHGFDYQFDQKKPFGPYFQIFGGTIVPRRYLNAGGLFVGMEDPDHEYACKSQDDLFASANLVRRGFKVKFTHEDYDTLYLNAAVDETAKMAIQRLAAKDLNPCSKVYYEEKLGRENAEGHRPSPNDVCALLCNRGLQKRFHGEDFWDGQNRSRVFLGIDIPGEQPDVALLDKTISRFADALTSRALVDGIAVFICSPSPIEWGTSIWSDSFTFLHTDISTGASESLEFFGDYSIERGDGGNIIQVALEHDLLVRKVEALRLLPPIEIVQKSACADSFLSDATAFSIPITQTRKSELTVPYGKSYIFRETCILQPPGVFFPQTTESRGFRNQK